MIAPEGISFTPDFDAIGTHFGISAPSGDYDPRMHNLFYSWSFDDPGDFVAPENILPEWQDANAAIGFRGRHVFRAPGTYTVRLDVAGYVGGEIVRAYSTLDVTIADPASTFAGAKTYFVSPSSDWTNAPSGSQHITSLDDAAGWANEDGAGPYRIMLNRGETHTFGGRRFGFNVTTGSTIHVVAGPGGGAAPILTCTGGFSAGANDDAGYATKSFVAQGLVLNGPYDPVTPSDPDVTSAFSFWGPYSPQQILVDRCEMRGFGHGIYIGDSVARHIYINDSVIEGYGQWGLIGSHYTGLSMLGWARCEAGQISPEDFADQLAREWASFPVVRDQKGAKRQIRVGQSYYAGDGLNKSHTTPATVLAAIREALAGRGGDVPSAPAPLPAQPPQEGDEAAVVSWLQAAPGGARGVGGWLVRMPAGIGGEA